MKSLSTPLRSYLSWFVTRCKFKDNFVCFGRSRTCMEQWDVHAHACMDMEASMERSQVLCNHTYELLSAATDQQSFFSNQISATRFHLMCLNISQQHQLVYPNQNKNLKFHTPCLHQGGACEAPISFLIVGDFWSDIMNASVDPVAVLWPFRKTLGSKQPPDLIGPDIIPATLWWMLWVILQVVIWLLLLVIVY